MRQDFKFTGLKTTANQAQIEADKFRQLFELDQYKISKLEIVKKE